MIDPSIESVPDQEKAAYLLENGDSLMVWNGESGWEYEFFDTSLEPVIGHRARGVTSLSEAMHLAMEQMNYTGLSFTAKDCDEFFALVKRSLETGYPPIVFPFLDREQVIINDVSVEPVVTITETTIYQLRSRMELPLHIADKLFAQLEQEQISQHGKREKKQCPAVRFRINYRIGGKDGVYQGVFYTGSGNGGLLLHMERAANRRQYYLQKHPEQGDLDACGYNCEIELGVLESPKAKKKGFLAMPAPVRDFVTGSCQNANRIYVLLVNMQLLTNGNMLTRSDYDYLVEGFYRPYDALRATRSIVIIDEPHRFSREQKAYKAIVEELQPEMIIRFGATFPESTIGRGKNKTSVKDFNNLVYELNACDSFNKNLIKGVAKEHFEPLSAKEEKVKIISIISKLSAKFQFLKRGEQPKTYTLTQGDSLSIIDPVFDGVVINAIGKNYIELSNGQTKFQGEEFNTDIYSSSYQEQMLKLAIQRHFETERQNFSGRRYKIKTLALFFIDDITSYRVGEDGKDPARRF